MEVISLLTMFFSQISKQEKDKRSGWTVVGWLRRGTHEDQGVESTSGTRADTKRVLSSTLTYHVTSITPTFSGYLNNIENFRYDSETILRPQPLQNQRHPPPAPPRPGQNGGAPMPAQNQSPPPVAQHPPGQNSAVPMPAQNQPPPPPVAQQRSDQTNVGISSSSNQETNGHGSGRSGSVRRQE